MHRIVHQHLLRNTKNSNNSDEDPTPYRQLFVTRSSVLNNEVLSVALHQTPNRISISDPKYPLLITNQMREMVEMTLDAGARGKGQAAVTQGLLHFTTARDLIRRLIDHLQIVHIPLLPLHRIRAHTPSAYGKRIITPEPHGSELLGAG
jgi:hypothetical protein